MKVKLKIIDNDEIYSIVNKLRESISGLNVKDIDNSTNNLTILEYELILDEKSLPEEFDDYIVLNKDLRKVFTDNLQLKDLINKALTQNKDILMVWDKEYE